MGREFLKHVWNDAHRIHGTRIFTYIYLNINFEDDFPFPMMGYASFMEGMYSLGTY